MNERAAGLVDAMAADADALGIVVRTLDGGARLVDCGAEARGGLQAGLGFAGACMGGLGRIDPVPVAVGERTWPGVGVAVDEPAAACLAAQYAGWKLEHDDFFAMASGPGRCAGARRGPVRGAGLARAGQPGGVLPGDRAGAAAGDRRQGRRALRTRRVGGHVSDRADRVGVRLGADLGPRRRDRAAQAPRARRRPVPGAPRLGLLPDPPGGRRRSGRDRPHQRRDAVRRHRPPVARGLATRRSPTSRSACPRRPRTRSAPRSGSCWRPPTGSSTTSIRCCSAPPRSR